MGMSSDPDYTARLLRKASRIAGRLNPDWYCVYVQTPEESPARIDATVQRKLVDNIQRAQAMGAEVETIQSEDIAGALLRFAREKKVTLIIVGQSRLGWLRRLRRGPVIDRLRRQPRRHRRARRVARAGAGGDVKHELKVPSGGATDERLKEYAALLAETASAVSRQLDEVRLPIHILLENHFGQLNENQEEMLAAAGAAAAAAGVELARLREIAELDRGALDFRRDRVRVGDLLQALTPQLEADGERAGVQVTIDVPPGLPLRRRRPPPSAGSAGIATAPPGAARIAGDVVTIGAGHDGKEIAIDVADGPAPMFDANVALAQRIVLAHGGKMDARDGRTRVVLPS